MNENENDNETIELPAVRTSHELLPADGRSTAQARVDAVSRTMDAAMNRASTLVLTPDEVSALKADFPDDAFKPGAAGKEHLIYIEHAFLRDRFDEVLGMGQWSILRTRPHWCEPFTTLKNEQASRVYADCVLLVRGCMVSESIGEMVYYPNNASQNYGDAAEGAVTAAFRRCAKNFGVGLQAWKKDFGEGWWARKRGQSPRQAPPAPGPRSATPAAKVWSPADWLAWLLVQCAPYPASASAVFTDFGLITAGDAFGSLTLDKLKGWTGAQVKELAADVAARAASDQIPGAEAGVPTDGDEGHGPPASAPNWQDAVLPFTSTKNPSAKKGMTLAQLFTDPLTSKTAFGLAMNYTAEPFKDRDGVTRPPSQESIDFAAGCAAWRHEHGKPHPIK